MKIGYFVGGLLGFGSASSPPLSYALYQEFLELLKAGGAMVNFEAQPPTELYQGLLPISSVASEQLGIGDTVLKVPEAFVLGLEMVDPRLLEAARRFKCGQHEAIALGILAQRRDEKSPLFQWFKNMPQDPWRQKWNPFLLYMSPEQQHVVQHSFLFTPILSSWQQAFNCVIKCIDWEGLPESIWTELAGFYFSKPSVEEVQWAVSIAKTRSFMSHTLPDISLLVPASDYFVHSPSPNIVRSAVDPTKFTAARNISRGELLSIEYAKASNFELLLRYGLGLNRDANSNLGSPYGAIQFDLTGEPVQSHCPSILLRHDLPEVVPQASIDCHREARHISFSQEYGEMTEAEVLREDTYIYKAVSDACLQMKSSIHTSMEAGRLEDLKKQSVNALVHRMLKELDRELVLLDRCVREFSQRQRESSSRPLDSQFSEEYTAFLKTFASMHKRNVGERPNQVPRSASL